jgi:hypothetical protein
MPGNERIDFIAEGLPQLLESARGFHIAAQSVPDRPREAEVLEGFAKEESAKILILLDAVRCPPKLLHARIGPILANFYSHLARLIYAEAVSWKPAVVSELRRYINNERKTHYLEGDYGEYILPNATLFSREAQMYVDIAADEDGKPHWHQPEYQARILPTQSRSILDLAEALDALGLLMPTGLKAISEVWGDLDFQDEVHWAEAEARISATTGRVNTDNLAKPHGEQKHADLLHERWQFPMYNIDFRQIIVTEAEMESERQSILYREIGGI